VNLTMRVATIGDKELLDSLIAESSRRLSVGDYTTEQIEAALGSAWGTDTELIRDGTYFVVEDEGRIVACGGWSRRRTLFGADAGADRQSEPLDPTRDAARIRAFFVHPEYARKGIGRALIERCESEARDSGFHSMELMATLPGRRLYETCGYRAGAPIQYPLRSGLTIEFVPMRKDVL
jgi:GNAT superfamily N-acetyltransferase